MSIADDALAAITAGGKGAAAGMALGPIGAAAGGLIGLASSLVPHVFGADAQPALAAVAQAITGETDEAQQVEVLSTDPAGIAQFKVEALKIAAAREKAQLDAQTDRITAQLGDVADARQQTVQLSQGNSSMQWAAPVVSVVIAIGFFGTMGGLTYFGKPIDPFVGNIVTMLVGALIIGFGQVCNFWLGSSAGSMRKTELLAAGSPAAPEPNLASESK